MRISALIKFLDLLLENIIMSVRYNGGSFPERRHRRNLPSLRKAKLRCLKTSCRSILRFQRELSFPITGFFRFQREGKA